MAPPFDREGALARADKFAQQGKLRAAIGELRRVLEHHPDDRNVLNALGDLYLRAASPAEAASCFERLGKAYADENATARAIAVYKKLARIDERNADVQFALAELSCAGRRKREARKYYQTAMALNGVAVTAKRPLAVLKKICDLDPSDTELRRELAANFVKAGYLFEGHEALVAAGRELLARGESAEAFAVFREALALSAASRPALSALAELLVADGRVDEAVELAAGALEREPSDADLLVILGRTYRRAGMLDDAERVFGRLFDVDPTRFGYLCEVGAELASRGETDRALAIAAHCSDTAVRVRQRDKIISLLEHVAACDPARDEALERVADHHGARGDHAQEAAALAKLADRAVEAGDGPRAARLLQRVVRVAPDPEPYKDRLVALLRESVGGEELGVEVVSDPDERGIEIVPDVEERGVEIVPDADERGIEIVPDAGAPAPAVDPGEVAPAAPAAQPAAAAAKLAWSPGPSDDEERAPTPERDPDPIEEKLVTLKDAYARAGFAERAAAQCLELARHYSKHGDDERTKDVLFEAFRFTYGALAMPPRARPSGAAPSGDASPLSKVLLVRPFDRVIDAEWRRAARSSKAVALLRIHVSGGPPLDDGPDPLWHERVGEAIESVLRRASDLLGRCGGGDFVALLPDTFLEGAATVAQKIHDRLGEVAREDETGVSVSIGVAAAAPRRGVSPDGLVRAAERAVGSARAAGGGRTVLAAQA